MEIRIGRDEFFKSVSRVQSIVERKSNMPILSTVLLSAQGDALSLSATDLELGFQQRLPAQVLEEGQVTISGRKLFEILKEGKKDSFHIKEKENHWVFMSDGVARFELACLPADEYPTFVEPEGVATVPIEGEVLSEMISKTIFSVTMEEAGFKLSGIFVEKVVRDSGTFLRMVSTDGHRLSLVEKPLAELSRLEFSKGIMVPKKGMNEISKLASEGGVVQLGFKQKNCVAKTDNALLVIRLLETKFPDYSAVIPQERKYAVPVSRIALLEGMRKMMILSSERYRAVKVTMAEGAIELVSTNPELGEGRESLTRGAQGRANRDGVQSALFH